MQYLSSLTHPGELFSLLKFKLTKDTKNIPEDVKSQNLIWCYKMLDLTSRSFAMVIRELPIELRDAICIFYLVLRALDTVEDDMSYPVEQKKEVLIHFNERLYQPGWTFNQCGEAAEKQLLEEFDKVIHCFLDLNPKYRKVIQDITLKMGQGMAEFTQKTVETVKDWDLYCYYVAGLVGVGLSKIFAASEYEDKSFADSDEISISMGLFLQKTNIIRDYLEDINQSRIFWPKAIWTKYSNKLENFKEKENQQAALECLNDLITNALEHLPDVFEYLSRLKNKQVFNFCAIPQIMAIGTLALCYNNANVFYSVVKMRRGESAQIILNMDGMNSVYNYFWQYLNLIESKIPKGGQNSKRAKELVDQVKERIRPEYQKLNAKWSTQDYFAGALFVSSSLYLFNRFKSKL
eukprot:TRINITY_DN10677_c0_g1_i1.p1 TRINITY_DN10677_c0_g1~~TRINITY_DN10677_c0_g1_i1.p1  ORF type:complete len:406 (-),score=120.25 TRINITY_DN10677_c0_g1_i1:70-1287(-)